MRKGKRSDLHQEPRRHRRASSVVVLLLAVCGGAAAAVLGVPAGWLIGALAVTAAVSIAGGLRPVRLDWAPTISFSIIGTALAAPFSRTSFSVEDAAWGVLLTALILGGSVVLGIITAAVTGIDRMELIVALLPGTAVAMLSICGPLGLDERRIATVQFIRISLVIFSAPIVAALFTGGPATDIATIEFAVTFPLTSLAMTVTSACGVVGWLLARAMRGTIAYLTIPPVLGVIADLAGLPLADVPFPIFAAALAMQGFWIGAKFNRSSLSSVGYFGLVGAMTSALLIVVSMAVGLLVVGTLGGEGSRVGILAGAPGAPEAMSAAAIDLGENAPLVLGMGLMRMFTLALIASLLSRCQLARNRESS